MTSKDVITVKEGNTTYTISLVNSTYTITNTEALVLPAFAGQTFKGKIDYIEEYEEGYDTVPYDAYIKFSSSEKLYHSQPVMELQLQMLKVVNI